MATSFILLVGLNNTACCEDIKSHFKDKHEVISIESGKECLSLFQDIYFKTKAILSNMTLPDMQGTDFLHKIREISVITEVIVVAENEQPRDIIQSMKEGACHFISGGVATKTLIQALDHFLSGANFIKKFEELSQKVLYETYDHQKRLELSRELVQKRKEEGKPLSQEEVLALFPYGLDKSQAEEISSELVAHSGMSLIENTIPLILVVEDETELRDGIKRILRGQFDVITVGSGAEAMAVLKEEPDIDIALLDIGLPDIKGTDLILELKKIKPQLEIVMLTAYEDVGNIVACFQNQAFDYLNKPFEEETLMLTVSRAIQKKNFKKVYQELDSKLIQQVLSVKVRLVILNDLFIKRQAENKPILMEDLWVFFPELKESSTEPKKVIPKKAFSEGILLYIEDLKSKIGVCQ